MIYAFIALALPEHVSEALEELQADLPVGRHLSPDTFHITLAYLDKQTEQTLERIHEVLAQMRFPEFDISITGVGVFGGRSPRIAWAGIQPSEPLTKLRDKVRRTAERSDIDLPRERFRPHITLSRFKSSVRERDSIKIRDFLARNAAFRLPPFKAQEVTFFRSHRHQTGATYEPIVSYALET